MDTDQLQGSRYEIKMRKLHKARKKALLLLEVEKFQVGREILQRYCDTCRSEILRLRVNYILSLSLQSSCKNFYLPNIRNCAEAYDYYLNMGFGILSAPMSYEEFLQRTSELQNKDATNNLGKFFKYDRKD